MCRSTMTADEWAALQERIKARYPRECPNCRDDSAFCPSFVDDSYQCGACSWVWFPVEES